MTKLNFESLAYEDLITLAYKAQNSGNAEEAQLYFDEAKRHLMDTALRAVDIYQTAMNEIENLSDHSFDLHDARRVAQRALEKVDALCL